MAVSSGPDIVDRGLVLALDAADRNSFDSNENLLTRSEEFNDGVWAKSQISITSNVVIAPDGSLTADKLVEASLSNTFYYLIQSFSGGNATYTHSLFAKQAETDRHLYFEVGNCRVGINISNGTIFSGPSTFGTGWSNPTVSIIPYPNGWYRCIITGTADNTVTSVSAKIHTATLTGGAGGIVYTGNGTSGIYIWGAQLERGSSASPYYPTTGTAKNRGSTLIDLTGRGNTGTLTNGPTYSSANGGSIVFDGTNDYVTSPFTFTAGQAVTILGWLYSTASTSAYRNFVDTSSNRPMIWWNTSGQIEFDTGSGYTTPAVYRNQWVYVGLVKPSGSTIASYYVNGVFASNGGVSYSVPASTPTWFNRGGSQTWIGNCSNASIYNRALTATEIEQNYNATRSRFGI